MKLERNYPAVQKFIDETLEISPMMGSRYRELRDSQQQEVRERLVAGLSQFTAADGSVSLPGSSLVAIASA